MSQTHITKAGWAIGEVRGRYTVITRADGKRSYVVDRILPDDGIMPRLGSFGRNLFKGTQTECQQWIDEQSALALAEDDDGA